MKPEDFEAQLPTLYRALRQAARRRGCSDVEEVVQGAVMATLCKVSTLVGGDAVPYAKSILYHMIGKTWRERGRAFLPLVDLETGEAIDVAVSPTQEVNVLFDKLGELIEELEKGFRDVLIAELEGDSLDEIAAAYGLPLGTVKSRLHRAKAQLRIKLHGAECWQRSVAKGHILVTSRPMGTSGRRCGRPARRVQPQATGLQQMSGERDIHERKPNQVLREKLQRWLRLGGPFTAPAT